MFGSAREDDFGKLQLTPGALGGTTQSAYIVVGDVDAAHAKAKAAGADMIGAIRQQSYGRDFSCRDPRAIFGTSAITTPGPTRADRASAANARSIAAKPLIQRRECGNAVAPSLGKACGARRWPALALSAKRRDA